MKQMLSECHLSDVTNESVVSIIELLEHHRVPALVRVALQR